MPQSDFRYIRVEPDLFNAQRPVFETDFSLDLADGENLVGGGYLLIMVRGVDSYSHKIEINGQDLKGFDIPKPPKESNAWLTYMDRIEPGVLRKDEPNRKNEIKITRVGNDDFRVKDIVVHWRKGKNEA